MAGPPRRRPGAWSPTLSTMSPRFSTLTVLPAELRVGDRIVDTIGEWVITSGPWTMATAKTVYVFVHHADEPKRRREFAWPEDEAVTVRRIM